MAMVSEAHVPLQNALGLSAATMRIIHQSAPGAGGKASKDDMGLRGAIATLQNIVSDLAKRIDEQQVELSAVTHRERNQTPVMRELAQAIADTTYYGSYAWMASLGYILSMTARMLWHVQAFPWYFLYLCVRQHPFTCGQDPDSVSVLGRARAAHCWTSAAIDDDVLALELDVRSYHT